MLLQKVAHYNDLSPKLREELEQKVKGFGKTVRYKFNISNPNPDPTKYNGAIIWPNVYTLDPTIFSINDPYEDRRDNGVSKSKRIAIIEGIDEKGLPNKFKKIRVEGKYQGILKLEIAENEEHFNYAMYLELHPKLQGGKFSDKTKHQVFSRVDEHAMATEQRTVRTARVKALNAAEQMSDKQVKDFSDAMMWDSTDDLSLLRNRVEELAETNPEFFNDLVSGEMVKYQAAVKQALDRQIISFDPAEWKFIWTSNQQPIAIVNEESGKNYVEQMAEWLQVNAEKGKQVYDKLKSLLK